MGMIERLLCWLFKHKDIYKDIDGKPSLYLRRWFILGNGPASERGWRLCLHKLARSDEDRDGHDHPWPFLTWILWGGYHDEQYFRHPGHGGYFPPSRSGPAYENMWPGKIAYRPALHLHRVRLKDNRPAWTLVWMGKPERKWGFVQEDGKWVYHKDYLNSGESVED